MQPALREYLTRLREQAYIDIKPGYTDSGASPNQTKLVYTSDVGPKTKQVRGKLGIGKKKTVVVVGKTKDEHQPAGSTSGLGLAKAEVDAKERAANDRKAAAEAASVKAAAEAAEKEKLSHMSPKEQKQYLAHKKHEARKEAKLDKKETRKQKKLAQKEAQRQAEEAKAAKSGKKPASAAPADDSQQADVNAPPKKKKSVSWF